MAKPTTEGKALGLTARESDILERSITRLTALDRALKSLNDITGSHDELCQECSTLLEGVRAIHQRFYPLNADQGE